MPGCLFRLSEQAVDCLSIAFFLSLLRLQQVIQTHKLAGWLADGFRALSASLAKTYHEINTLKPDQDGKFISAEFEHWINSGCPRLIS